MSQPRGFGINGMHLFSNVSKPIEVWCAFTVASTNTNGWGVTSVKSNGYVEAVFMHTTQTPGLQNQLTNPNPQAGYAVVRFRNNFNVFLAAYADQYPPLGSTGTTSLTQGNVYVITALGNTTTAQWQTAGLIPGVTPAVGATFVAAATASIGGTGTVGIPAAPTASTLTVVGDPNQVIANTNIAGNAGAQVVVGFLGATNSSTTTLIPTAPANGTVVNAVFYFDGSTVSVDGL